MIEDEPQLYKLFISQVNEKSNEYEMLIGKLSSVDDFSFDNFSVPDETSREDLIEQMKDVDAVVILSGLYSANKNLIQLQIDVALELEKPIVIVRPYGMENVPGSIENAANEVIGWNAGCIIDAIVESSQSDNYED